MKQHLAWTGSADSTITSEAVMAMAEKFNTGQEVCLQISNARGVMQVKEGTSGSVPDAARHRICGCDDQRILRGLGEGTADDIGACLCRPAFEREWVARMSGTRAISITTVGRRAFRDVFDA
jgi:hypothetical protein